MNKQELIEIYTKYKFFFLLFIIVVSSIILTFFVIYPQVQKLISDQDQIRELNKKTTLLEDKAQKLDSINEDDLKEKLAVALRALPAETDFAQALGMIQTLANSYQFIIVNFQTSLSTEKEGLKLTNYSVNLDLVGPKILVQRFVDSINENFRLMRTVSLQINVTGKKEEATTVVSVDIFYSRVPATVGAIDAPLPEISNSDEEFISELARSQPVVEAQPILTGPRGKANPFE